MGGLKKLEAHDATMSAVPLRALRAAAPPPTSDDEGYTLHAFLVAVFAATIADGATAEAACQVLGVPDVPPEVAHTLSGK